MSLLIDRIIVVSEALKQNMIKRGVPEKKLVRVYNGVDWDELSVNCDIAQKKSELSLETSGPIIGIIARLMKQKGHKYLLDAAVLILREIPEARFLIVGQGILRKELENYAYELGLKEKVTFTGFRYDIPQILKVIDVFVQASVWEPLSNALLEAAAMGKAIVATDVDGTAEVLKHNESGILIPPENSSAIAQAVVELLKNDKLASRIGKAAKKVIENNFSLKRMTEHTEAVYVQLLERPKRNCALIKGTGK